MTSRHFVLEVHYDNPGATPNLVDHSGMTLRYIREVGGVRVTPAGTMMVGAEEHVVTAGVGSSQYGGSVRAQDKTKKGKKTLGTNFKGIRPEPSDGSKDYRNNHPASDFEGFGFFVMADAPVRDRCWNFLFFD